MKEILLPSGHITTVSDEDYVYLNQWKWHLTSKGYVARRQYIPGRKSPIIIFMHRVILDAPDGILVDHKNQNKLCNERWNIKLSDHSKNRQNAKCTNRLGYTGITERSGRYQAGININKVWTDLGTYDTVEIAAREYDKAALEHYGPDAHINFPMEGGDLV